MDDVIKASDRRCFVVDREGEREVGFERLRDGDVFYLLEPGGEIVTGEAGNMLWLATGDAEKIGGLWRVSCCAWVDGGK